LSHDRNGNGNGNGDGDNILKSGEITIKKGEAVAAKFPISAGILEVKKDETVILITKA